MPQDFIHVKGAREHNLKNIEITVPRDKLVVITGVSGSGKSSLAFDTIYAEGQRRYVESLSAYARQFLGRMDKPDVDYIEGLSPAISIDQKGVSHNPRSTVGTVTEIYDYLRLLFARVGVPHCPKCDSPVARQTVSQIVDAIMSLEEGSRITLLAPKVRRKKGEHKDVFEAARRAGFVRIRVNGEIMMLDEIDNLNLNKQKWHYIELVVDRIIIRPDTEMSRVAESVETCLREAEGVVEVLKEPTADSKGETLVFSEQFACAKCNVSCRRSSRAPSASTVPHGACGECTGLGYKLAVDPELVIPNKNLTLSQGAITPVGKGWDVRRMVHQPDGSGGGGQRLLGQGAGAGTGAGAHRPDPVWKRQQESDGEPPHPPGAHLQLGHQFRGRYTQPGAAIQDDRVGRTPAGRSSGTCQRVPAGRVAASAYGRKRCRCGSAAWESWTCAPRTSGRPQSGSSRLTRTRNTT